VERFEDKIAFILGQDEIQDKLDCMNAEFTNNMTCMDVIENPDSPRIVWKMFGFGR